MRRRLAVLIIAIVSLFAVAAAAGAQTSVPNAFGAQQQLPSDAYVPDQFYRANVTDILDKSAIGGAPAAKAVWVEIVSGDETGKRVEIDTDPASVFTDGGDQQIRKGETIVVGKSVLNGDASYYIADKFRLPALALVVGIFLALVIGFSRLKGFTSILGLVVSGVVLLFYVIPRILAGENPATITFVAAVAIAFTSIYLAHGFNKRTHVAVGSTLITLGLAFFIANAFVAWAKLFGLGTEDAFLLQSSLQQPIDFRGLLLGGIILGALGVLDDVTTGQAATVDELLKANSSLSFSALYRGGISVGKEHISSLVNTLFLAYAGVSLPLFVLFKLNGGQPFWVLLNGEFLAEEIVRTLAGSVILILAVPITTVLAAWLLRPRAPRQPSPLP